jgi:hypothetical protein
VNASGGSGSGPVDVVRFARAIGVSSQEEVWDHLIATLARAASVNAAVEDLERRMADYPEDLRADVRRARLLVEGVGEHLYHLARASSDR